METFELNSQYEILFLSNGDIYLSNIYGKNLCISNPSEEERWYFRSIDDGGDPHHLLSSVLEKFGETAIGQIRVVYDNLRKSNVFRPVPKSDNQAEIGRFRSQLAWLAEFSSGDGGCEPFRLIRRARVACIGAGGAGSQCAVMLTAAGIGGITLIDGDHVSETNLIRQPYYSEQDAREKVPKVQALAMHLRRLSSYSQIQTLPKYLTTESAARAALFGHDLVLMTADSPRILINRLINRVCVSLRTPLLYAFFGQIGPMYVPNESPCFACLENTWRQEAGDEYDLVVEALQARPTREYPSLISGPVQVADAMFMETLALITKASSPQTLGAVLRLDGAKQQRCEVRPKVRCDLCGFE